VLLPPPQIPAVFAKLRRDEIKIERMIKFRFVADPWDFLIGFVLVAASSVGKAARRIALRVHSRFQGAVAHFDVVLLAAGK